MGYSLFEHVSLEALLTLSSGVHLINVVYGQGSHTRDHLLLTPPMQ